jgi:tetratricopeptide (TPR) repeat protein
VSEEETKQSRRARRRAEREAEAREAEAPEPEEAEAEAEDGGGEEEAAAGAQTEDAPRAPSRAERRAAKKAKARAEAGGTEDIRDKNQRLRDKAAARRREKREREAAVARGLDAGEMVDDALARATHGATSFLRRHFNIVQWVIVLGVAGGIGYQIWAWRHGKNVAKASDALYAGVEAELGRVGAEEPADPLTGLADPTRVFATDEARLSEAAKKYEEAATLRKGSGTAILAKLGLAGVLYDQGKYDEAIAAYEDVKASDLAKHDADVRLRAAEGVGLAREAKGDLDGALKAFKELENADVVGFKGLGLLHAARVHYVKGDKTKAKELAKAAQEQTTKEKSPYQTAGYLDSASRELLAAIDPSTIPPTPAAAAGYSPEQMDALREQIMKDPTKLQKMLQEMGKSVPKLPEMPMPPPMEPPEPAPPSSGTP